MTVRTEIHDFFRHCALAIAPGIREHTRLFRSGLPCPDAIQGSRGAGMAPSGSRRVSSTSVPANPRPEVLPSPPPAGPPTILDRTLNLFADVRSGESITAVLLMLDIFIVLAAYYLLKTIRESLILAPPGGAETKAYTSALMAGILIVLVPVYSSLASRLSRVRLINGVTTFFIGCLGAFFAAHQAGIDVGVPFFIWVGIFNVMTIAQMWAFANDIYTVEQGKRLFAIVGFGASLGAIAGAFVSGRVVKAFGPYPVMLGAAAALGLSLIITNWISVHDSRSARARAAVREADPTALETRPDGRVGGRSGFMLVLTDRYLGMIAALMVLLNVVNTTGEYILGKHAEALVALQHPHATEAVTQKLIGGYYGNYFTLTNLLAAAIQLFLVSRVIKSVGVRGALLVLPLVALAGYTTLAFVPAIALGLKVTENSLDYSLQNTTRNALYLPTSREAKYKAKQANDTFFVRFGDFVSAALVFLAAHQIVPLTLQQFSIVNVCLIVFWLLLAVLLGKRFASMAHTA